MGNWRYCLPVREQLVAAMRLLPSSKVIWGAPVRTLLLVVLTFVVTSVMTFLVSVFSAPSSVVTLCLFLVPSMSAVRVGFNLSSMMFVVIMAALLVVSMVTAMVMTSLVTLSSVFTIAIWVSSSVPFPAWIMFGVSTKLSLKWSVIDWKVVFFISKVVTRKSNYRDRELFYDILHFVDWK